VFERILETELRNYYLTENLGWFFVVDGSGAFLYYGFSSPSLGWLYSTESTLPWFWYFDRQGWVFFQKESVCWFCDLNTHQYFDALSP
jgi:hypothetical protein